MMKGEGDRLHFEDGHTGKWLCKSGKRQCAFVGFCWNVTKYKTLLDKSFQANNRGFMERVWSTRTLSGSWTICRTHLAQTMICRSMAPPCLGIDKASENKD